MSYRALIVPPDGECREVTIDDFTDVRGHIGGHLELLFLGGSHAAWVNEDGLRLQLPPNPRISALASRPIVGTAVCWGNDGTPDEADVDPDFVAAVSAMVLL